MPKIHLRTDHNHNVIDPERAKARHKAKPYVEQDWVGQYKRERNIIWLIEGKQHNWDSLEYMQGVTEKEIELVKQEYFKNYQTTLL